MLHTQKRLNDEQIKQAKVLLGKNEAIWEKEKALSPISKFGGIRVGGSGSVRGKHKGALTAYNKAHNAYRTRKQQFEQTITQGLRDRGDLTAKINQELGPARLEEVSPSLVSHTPSDIFGVRSPGPRSPRERRSREATPPRRRSRRGSREATPELAETPSPTPSESGVYPTLADYMSDQAANGRVDIESMDLTVNTPRDDMMQPEWRSSRHSETDSSRSIPVNKREANEQLFGEHVPNTVIDLEQDVPEIPTGFHGFDLNGYLDRLRGIQREQPVVPDRAGRPRRASVGAPAAPGRVPLFAARADYAELQKRALRMRNAQAPRMVAALPGTHQPTFSNRGVLSQSFGSRMGAGRHVHLGSGSIKATRGSATITLSRKNPQDIAEVSAFLTVNFQFGAKIGGTRYALVGLVPAVLSKLPGTVSVST